LAAIAAVLIQIVRYLASTKPAAKTEPKLFAWDGDPDLPMLKTSSDRGDKFTATDSFIGTHGVYFHHRV